MLYEANTELHLKLIKPVLLAIFDQAENRLHAQKALMVSLIG